VDSRLSATLLDGRLGPGQHVTVARDGDALAFQVSDGDGGQAPAQAGQAAQAAHAAPR
jgi:hypothetical protein